MGYTKRQFIEAAHGKIGLSSYVFDMPVEKMQEAKQDLDAMMADWNAKGIRLGYPVPSSPEGGDLDDETNVLDAAWTAIIYNLALRVGDSFGKAVPPRTATVAKNSYNTLLSRAAMPTEMQFPSTLPAGAGNKPWIYSDPFVTGPVPTIDAGPDGPLEFN